MIFVNASPPKVLDVETSNFAGAYSVGRCVIPWEFLGKSVKHTFSCRKMYFV